MDTSYKLSPNGVNVSVLISETGSYALFFKSKMNSFTVSNQPNELTYGAESSSIIPNKIWSFWDTDGSPVPSIVTMCIDSWKKHNPTYEIVLLNRTSLATYLPTVDFSMITRAHDSVRRFSDFVRLLILAEYGGFWIDSSIICHKPFDWTHAVQKKQDVDFVGYYLDKFTVSNYKSFSPVIESWFFACVPKSPFVIAWRDEFMRTNQFSGVGAYLTAIERLGICLQKIDNPDYLLIHVCAQVIMQRNMTGYKITLFQAEFGAYKYLVDANWDTNNAVNLLVDPATAENYFEIPIVKLRGNEREVLDKNPNKSIAFN